MPVAIHAAQKALSSVFSNKFAFSIPAYQRPYAWTKDQAVELLTDLLSFLGDASEAVSAIAYANQHIINGGFIG